MALTKISASVIAANAIVAAGVAENSISTSEIATDGVGTLQISDGAVTSGKLDTNIDIAGTLDVTGVLTADSNVVIAGNLTVNGATVTNSSTNTTIADALIELGTGTTGSPANDAGIVIERGDSDNAFIGWDESADTFILGTGSFTGASTGNLTISTAPLSVGTLTASGITYPTSDGSSGQVLKTDGSGNLTFDAQTAVVDNFTATGDGSTTDFDTGINPGDEVNTWVFIDGVYQQKGEYSYSGSTISFSTAPDSGATIDVTTGTVGGFASADSVLGVYEATTTNTDTYATGISASNENNTWVFVGGVYQPKDSYTFSSGTLTFDANTPTGQKLSVVATKTITAGAVDTSTLAANAVTSAKIASNSILSRHIANNSIVGADISATTQITASTFTGALTGDVTGNVVGNLTGTIQTAAQTNITSVGTLSALTVSGQLTAGGLSYPTSDGTNEQVLRTDGSGNLSFGTISGTTINNNTNNYVMTGTGTANTLNGESGLTYDGSTLAVTGNVGIGTSLSGNSANKLTLRKDSVTNIVDTLLLNNGSADNQAGTGVRINMSGVSETNSDIRYAYIESATSSTGNNHYLAFGTNAATSTPVERMRIDSSGNVGIGNTNPAAFNTLGGKQVVIGDGTQTNNLTLYSATTGASVGYGHIAFADSNTSSSTAQYAGLIQYYHGDDSMAFYTGSTKRMTIDGSGNVGIGTTSPVDMLTLAGTTKLLTFDTAADASFSGIRWSKNLAGGDSTAASITSTNEGNYGRKGIGFSTGNNQDFTTDAIERMRIASDGKVLINTTSAIASSSAKFFVRGLAGIVVQTTSYPEYQPLILHNNASTANNSSTLNYITFQSLSNGTVGTITSVGTTTSYNTSSDYRLKENVDYTWDATTRLKQLKPARFNFISDADKTVDGFLAHEVQDIVPEAITGQKDAMKEEEYEVTPEVLDEDGNVVTEAVWGTRTVPDYQGIDQSKLVPLLVKTIQELEERITALEG